MAMQISKLQSTNSKRVIYRVYNDGLPFETINMFLRFQEKREYAPNTVRANAYDLKEFFNYLKSQGLDWEKVSDNEIVNYIHHLRFTTSHENLLSIPLKGVTKSEKTIQRMLSSILNFYKYYYLNNGVYFNISHINSKNKNNFHYKGFFSFVKNKNNNIDLMRRPIQLLKNKKDRKKVKTLSPDQIIKLIDLCNNSRDRLLILLLVETGMRIGQALQLRHEDIETWDSRLKIVYRLDNPNEVYAKTHEPYYIHLSKKWINLYTEYLINDADNSDSEFVFTTIYSTISDKEEKPYSYAAAKDLFKRLSKKLGFNVTPHMLRHTHATELLRNGVSIEMVAKRLGHKSIETTKSIYEHLNLDDLRIALKTSEK